MYGIRYSRLILVFALLAAFVLAAGSPAAAGAEDGEAPSAEMPSAETIVTRLEENKFYNSARMEGRLVVEDGFGRRVSAFISWTRGEDLSLIEFTSKQERGQKILKEGDEIQLYYPQAARPIRIQGNGMKDSVMNSDMSYEDMVGGEDILEDYRVELLGEEPVDGRPCWRLKLTARENRSRRVAYYRQELWVDQELYTSRRIRTFSRSGRALKEIRIREIEMRDGTPIPRLMEIDDQLKKNSSTEFHIDEIDLQADVPMSRFSLEELTW